jgi:hypothetical protein
MDKFPINNLKFLFPSISNSAFQQSTVLMSLQLLFTHYMVLSCVTAVLLLLCRCSDTVNI